MFVFCLSDSDFCFSQHIVLVHGEENEMRRLKNALDKKYKGQKIQIYTPRNEEPVKMEFRSEKVGRAVSCL